MSRYDCKKIKKKLKTELDKARYEHTIGVMDTAACLAMRYDCDFEKAQVAGLLHDCAKCIPNDSKLRMCKKFGIEITSSEKKAPFLLHAMSLLDKIIFIADYIEPGRDKAPNLQEIRRLAFQDIDKALIHILKDTLSYLEESGQQIDPTTRAVLEYYTGGLANDN